MYDESDTYKYEVYRDYSAFSQEQTVLGTYRDKMSILFFARVVQVPRSCPGPPSPRPCSSLVRRLLPVSFKRTSIAGYLNGSRKVSVLCD